MVGGRGASYGGAMSDSPTPIDDADFAPPTEDDAPAAPRRPGLHRSRSQRMIAGVAGGLGERFDVDATVVRLIFVGLAIVGGAGVVLYVAMWILLPDAETPDAVASPRTPRARRSRAARVVAAMIVVVVVIALVRLATRGGGFGGPLGGSGWGVRPIFGLAWLVLLVALVAVAARGGSRGRGLWRVFATLLLVGLSALVLSVGAGLTYLATTGVPIAGGSGSRTWQPTSLADVHHQYRTFLGTETVDLRSVRFPASGYRVAASVTVGVLTVWVPAGAVVDLHTHVGAGTTSTYLGTPPNWWNDVPFRGIPSSLTSAAQIVRAPHLNLDAEVGAGRLNIVRAGR